MKDSKSQERLKKPKSINLQLASARQDRLNKLATSTSPNLLKMMSSGVIPHFHPSTIEYRDKPYKDNIYLRKYFSFSYKPDKQRVTETEEAYKSSHLESEKYFKLRPDYLRESGYSFRPDNRFKPKPNLNLRVQSSALACSGLMLKPHGYSHTFRDVQKEKWTQEKDFVKTVKQMKKFEAGINSCDMYVDGFQVVGDVCRKRVKELEIAGDFKPNHDKDAWGKMFEDPGSCHNFNTRIILQENQGEGKWYPATFKNFNIGKNKSG